MLHKKKLDAILHTLVNNDLSKIQEIQEHTIIAHPTICIAITCFRTMERDIYSDLFGLFNIVCDVSSVKKA